MAWFIGFVVGVVVGELALVLVLALFSHAGDDGSDEMAKGSEK